MRPVHCYSSTRIKEHDTPKRALPSLYSDKIIHGTETYDMLSVEKEANKFLQETTGNKRFRWYKRHLEIILLNKTVELTFHASDTLTLVSFQM